MEQRSRVTVTENGMEDGIEITTPFDVIGFYAAEGACPTLAAKKVNGVVDRLGPLFATNPGVNGKTGNDYPKA